MTEVLRISRKFNTDNAWFNDIKDKVRSKLKHDWDLDFFPSPSLTVMGKDEFARCAKRNELSFKVIDSLKDDLKYELALYSNPLATTIGEAIYLRKNSHSSFDRSNIAVKFRADTSLMSDRITITNAIDAATPLINKWPMDYIFNLSVCHINNLQDNFDMKRINQQLGGIVLPKVGVVFGDIEIESHKYGLAPSKVNW